MGAVPILDSTQRIDLMISDVGLPGMNGRQLAEIGRQMRPDLKVLFITGYAEHAGVRAGFLDTGMQMITKPFTFDQLTAKVREMIKADTSAGASVLSPCGLPAVALPDRDRRQAGLLQSGWNQFNNCWICECRLSMVERLGQDRCLARDRAAGLAISCRITADEDHLQLRSQFHRRLGDHARRTSRLADDSQ
jgi:hypothetical protein